MSDPRIGRFYQSMQERCTAISTDLVFFALELNHLDDGLLQDKLQAPELARYAPWLRALRARRPPQLSADIERPLHDKRSDERRGGKEGDSTCGSRWTAEQ